MPDPRLRKCRFGAAVLFVAVAIAGAAACVGPARAEVVTNDAAAGFYVAEARGFRYEFHAPSHSERLRAIGTTTDVMAEHPDLAAECRRAVEDAAGVESLEELSMAHEDALARLKGLGYL